MNSTLHALAHHREAPALSPDGYIRLSLTDLSALPFMHLASGNDPDFLAELKEQTVPADAAGFSEWISATTPTISLGWSWFIHNPSNRLLLAPNAIRSNVMLIDIHGYDLGSIVTANLFSTWLTVYDWQQAVSRALSISSTSTC